MFASYALLLGWAAGNSVVFGEYVLHSVDIDVNRWNQRGIGFACITVAFFIHACAVKWGLRLQNVLGILKLLIIALIVIGGIAALSGKVNLDVPPNNFASGFKGSNTSAYGVVTALYCVIWSYIGYSNANYVSIHKKYFFLSRIILIFFLFLFMAGIGRDAESY